ncbi:hypothetical protein OGR47_11245 [Methylocystis sp. MJC1]|uniref:hypothetical protein n=1 Tax=Methylocystis sp. MJC1 TaxID=2654282 RepID=UPI0013EC9F22|nr:hypothetical protein [Methylocystis sp. MJC1]KAF2992423.1 hypothetical protein MJC1_00804 [Methylocystis sp. MJC1]MBU6527559.1 hypothetical protein [Methylocystis sp. MJC1]UZX10499.1 hypothetical protein OGR47_11245 [Methylocystis sp. MJC1]
MRRLVMIAATMFLAGAAQAEPDFSTVLDSETLSFVEGNTDRAVLVENGDSGADLYLYLNLEPARDISKPMKAAAVKKSVAWSGGMWGTRPSLETSAKGSLLIKSENTGVGRDRWTQTLTVVYRNKDFVVAGLTRESYDTLDPKAVHSCDLNFLSGKGKRDGKAIEVKTPAKKLADWSDDAPAKECVF